jgi:hypothetical protein
MRLAAFLLAAATAHAATFYVTIAGLGGEPEYEQRFHGWASDLKKIVSASADARVETLEKGDATKANIRATLDKVAKEAKAEDALVVTLIGHGSFDGADYKFNIPGPDVTAAELAGMLDRIPAKRQLVVNMTSASGGAIPALRRENRVVITATKAGTEKNATIFARYWVEALRDGAADTDKNETVSALEAFRYAEAKTAKFYEQMKRLATEHAVIEDTGKGDGVKSPSPENGYGLVAGSFPVLRMGTLARSSDPERRKLIDRKEDLEQQIDKLKYQKAAMPIEDYRRQLGALLLELSKTQAELDKP